MPLQEELEKQGNVLFRYRSYIPIGFILFIILYYLINWFFFGVVQVEKLKYSFIIELLAVIVGLIGLSIRILTVGYTPKNTSGRNTSEGQVADTLNTTGIYSLVRHPLYLGNYLMWISPIIYTGEISLIIITSLFYWVYYERIMYAEEQFLRRKFGEQYLSWANKTPAFFPKRMCFKRSNLNFSWKKVLKKEKNGLFALFFILCFIDIMIKWLSGSHDYNNFLIVMCIITGALYAILKVLWVLRFDLCHPFRFKWCHSLFSV